MEILLNDKEVKEVLHNALCNGLGWISGYGLSVKISKEDYAKAKNSLKDEDFNVDSMVGSINIGICMEDVLMKHLEDGNELEFYDSEQEEEVGFTFEQAKENLKDENVTKHIMDMLNENDDAITADCILQTALYGEIVFG
jgi:hypothetical protein